MSGKRKANGERAGPANERGARGRRRRWAILIAAALVAAAPTASALGVSLPRLAPIDLVGGILAPVTGAGDARAAVEPATAEPGDVVLLVYWATEPAVSIARGGSVACTVTGPSGVVETPCAAAGDVAAIALGGGETRREFAFTAPATAGTYVVRFESRGVLADAQMAEAAFRVVAPASATTDAAASGDAAGGGDGASHGGALAATSGTWQALGLAAFVLAAIAACALVSWAHRRRRQRAPSEDASPPSVAPMR